MINTTNLSVEARQLQDKIAVDRGCFPAFVRCDNGPELTANALRDWCRFTGDRTPIVGPPAM
jgi:putative transposase